MRIFSPKQYQYRRVAEQSVTQFGNYERTVDMDIYSKIRLLIRLAELCTPVEADRKNGYMDKVDELMDRADELECANIKDAAADILNAFDFDVPESQWTWIVVSELLKINRVVFNGYCAEGLGHRLAAASRSGCGIRRKRTTKGTMYYLPPVKKVEDTANEDVVTGH